MIKILVAFDENRVIGKNNELIWHLPADLKRFKALTTGHVIIMGRKTYDSIGKPLPNRTTIVISRTPGLQIEGVICTNSVEEAILKAKSLRFPLTKQNKTSIQFQLQLKKWQVVMPTK